MIALLNNSGTAVVQYTYDAWGKILTTTGNMASTLGQINPLRYRGYVYDNETGLYYLQSRYYDPEIGRFINADTVDLVTATPMGLTDKNLFAYCDNNPVVRADDGGQFWHIVVGAAAGAVIGAFVTGVVSYAETGTVDWAAVGLAAVSGALSGALASTGAGIVGIAAGNAAISMAENAANQVVDNNGFNNFDVGDMLFDGAIGGVAGALGGAGTGTKHLTNLGKQTVKRTFNTTVNKGLKAGLKEAGKAFVYYGKNTVKHYKNFAKSLIRDAISSFGTSLVTSSYMKLQYRRALGR